MCKSVLTVQKFKLLQLLLASMWSLVINIVEYIRYQTSFEEVGPTDPSALVVGTVQRASRRKTGGPSALVVGAVQQRPVPYVRYRRTIINNRVFEVPDSELVIM